MNITVDPALLAPGLPPGHVPEEPPPPGLRGAMALSLVVVSLCVAADAFTLGSMVWVWGSVPPFGLWFWAKIAGGNLAAVALFAGAVQMLRRSPSAMRWLAVGTVVFAFVTMMHGTALVAVLLATPKMLAVASLGQKAIHGGMLAFSVLWWCTKLGSAVWAYRQTHRREVAEWLVAGQD